jgi:hypothetical protein
MKKILNEWRRFVLKEGLTLQDERLGAPAGWFSEWNGALGNIDYKPEWRQKLASEYSDVQKELKKIIMDPSLDKAEKREYQRALGALISGFAYYSRDPRLNQVMPPFEEIVELKLKMYFDDPNISQENKDFFAANYERIMDYGVQSMAPNRQIHGTRKAFSGNTAFMGSMDDWYMFGDGISETRKVMDNFFMGMDRPEGTEAPEERNLADGSPEFQDELSQRAAMMNAFFDNLPEPPKRKRRRRK